MKNRFYLFMNAALALLMITSTVHSQNRGAGRKLNQNTEVQSILDLPLESLSDSEIESLLLMREEEKLARDAYLALYEKWNMLIFNNIAQSEQQHTDIIKLLLDKYELDDPFVDEFGVFTNEDLSALYEELVTFGSQSKIDALTVGMTIEDLDIYDLDEALKIIDNIDIQTVYENLMKGSRNHLRSFYKQLTAQGGSYEPQYISLEEYEAILASDMERGGNSSGRTQGNKPRQNSNKSSMKSTGSIKAGCFPNPANPTTTIQFSLSNAARTTITIYNTMGRTVRFYNLGQKEAGSHLQSWDARDNNGQPVSSGVYLYKLQAGNASVTRRLMLVQ